MSLLSDQLRTSDQSWKYLFGSVSKSDFFSQVWETQYLHGHGVSPTAFAELFDIAAMEAVLNTSPSAYDVSGASSLSDRDVKLVRRTKGRDGEWWSGMLPISAAAGAGGSFAAFARSAFNQGFTLVLNRLNLRWTPLYELCSALSQHVFGYRCDVNLYFSPANAQGFEAHFDWMESIVIQLQGHKQWSIYGTPIRLPRADQKYKPKSAEIGPVLQDLVMAPGDVLYFPSGMVHEARTARDVSMHLTIGIEVDVIFTYTGVLMLALNRSMERATPSAEPSAWLSVPSSTCTPLSTSELSSSSRWTWLDMLQLSILEVASRRSQFAFRRSVSWLAWSDTAEATAAIDNDSLLKASSLADELMHVWARESSISATIRFAAEFSSKAELIDSLAGELLSLVRMFSGLTASERTELGKIDVTECEASFRRILNDVTRSGDPTVPPADAAARGSHEVMRATLQYMAAQGRERHRDHYKADRSMLDINMQRQARYAQSVRSEL